MKSLVMMRHAKSSWDDYSLKDQDRPLNERGCQAADMMGHFWQKQTLPDLVLCSTALRTRETWSRIRQTWPLEKEPSILFLEPLYLASAETILKQIRANGGMAENIAVLGHNPGIRDFVVKIVKSDEANQADTTIGKYPTGAWSLLQFELREWCNIGWQSGKLTQFCAPKSLLEH